MAHTFDIRFARTAGLLEAFLSPAENSFRWKGDGKLRIEADGISIAVRRGLLSLWPSSRRIPAANIRDVYREGDALRLTVATPDMPRAIVSCWASDAETAAEIVQLLPTRRTVEIEPTASASSASRRSYDRSAILLLFGLVAVLVGVGLWIRTPGSTSSEVLAPVAAPQIPVAVNLAQPRILSAEDFVVPIPAGTPQFAIAVRHLAAFEQESARLLDEYRVDRKLLESGAMDAATFANRLDKLELAWWNVTFRILDDPGFTDFSLLDFRANLMASARHWRNFLSRYATAIRKGDHVMIAASFDEMARAEQLQARARIFLRH
jgi:hypothetical protein